MRMKAKTPLESPTLRPNRSRLRTLSMSCLETEHLKRPRSGGRSNAKPINLWIRQRPTPAKVSHPKVSHPKAGRLKVSHPKVSHPKAGSLLAIYQQ
jgi:hypothetical protein